MISTRFLAVIRGVFGPMLMRWLWVAPIEYWRQTNNFRLGVLAYDKLGPEASMNVAQLLDASLDPSQNRQGQLVPIALFRVPTNCHQRRQLSSTRRQSLVSQSLY